MNNERSYGRDPGALRPVRIERGYARHAEGSALIEFGETRVLCTASITGAFVAAYDALRWLHERQLIGELPLRDFVAAVSVGVHDGRVLVDLDYAEDSTCATDMNVVMTGSGGFVEVQGTAEGAPFSQQELDAMLVAARSAIGVLVQRQRAALGLA